MSRLSRLSRQRGEWWRRGLTLALAAGVVVAAGEVHAAPGGMPEGPEPNPAPVGDALEQHLLAEPPPFCRGSAHVPDQGELALCRFAPAARPRCPEFAAACERAAQNPADVPPSLADHGWLSVLFWLVRGAGMLLVSGLLAVIVMALLSLWRAQAAATVEEPSGEGQTSPRPGPSPAPPDAPERHLAAARALAAAGEHSRALAELHLGILLRLSAAGLIQARPGRTNGDYARELSPSPELQRAFRELSRAAEAVQFGGQRLDAAGFERLLGRAAALLPALLCALALASCGLACGGAAPARTRAVGCGTNADGNSLLCALIEARGGSVSRRYRPLEGLDDSVDQIILLPHALGAPSVAALTRWVEAGGVLVLAAPLEPIDERLGLSRSEAACGPEASLGAGEPSRLIAIGTSLVAPRLTGFAWCPGGEPYVAHGGLGDGTVIALPTPALLSNASLVAGDNARLLLGLLGAEQAVVEIVGAWTRDSAEHPLGQLHAAGLLPWLLQLLVLGLCFGVYRGAPFGRRREPPGTGRRRFSEHAVALGQRWSDARAADTALAAYAALAIELLRERLPVAAEQGEGELARAIADRTGWPVEVVLRTLERARRARHGAVSGVSEAEQLATARLLGRLLEQTGGGPS